MFAGVDREGVAGMRTSIMRLMLLASVAALLLAVTACGGSKKSSSSASSETTPAVTTTITNAGSSTSDGTSATTATTSSDDSSSTTSDNVAKKCLDFASAAGKLGQALAAGASPTANSEGLKNYFDGLAEKAPSEIKAAFRTLAEAMGKYVDGIKGLNLKAGQTPSAADLAKLQAAVASLSTPDIQAASNKIQAWVSAGCHS
jgi:hypothetical protein